MRASQQRSENVGYGQGQSSDATISENIWFVVASGELGNVIMKIGFRYLVLVSIACFVACQQQADPQVSDSQNENEVVDPTPQTPDAISLSGKPLYAPKPSEKLLNQLEERKRVFEANPNDPDALIWYGRFVAYSGDYDAAIEIFTNGAKQFPDDARMLRHAGHRFISIRKFDQAIEVLERATELIKGKENEIEPDGMPNAQDIPVSTLHGNIWYHLGLAYYLKHDFENALRAYKNCLTTAGRPDNVVSATHWIYMINRRLGHTEAANQALDAIELEMDVIENMGYHKCCCFYKGLMTLDALEATIQEGLPREAIDYAIGNWHLYNGDPEKARQRFELLTSHGAWNAFGFIAAESDLAAGP